MGETTSGKLKVAPRGDREIVLERILDAPRDLVFKVLTDPQLVPKWWGRTVDTATVDKMDVRPGGLWRFVTRSTDGDEHAFRGEFREIVPPERLVQTVEWEGLPGHISVETMTLEDEGGKTKMTITSLFDSVEDRDGMLQSGMETGASETYDRLEELLATMR